jgi:hypothetical protein
MQSPTNNGRAKVTKTDDGVYIVIPSVKNWPILAFLGFWLCGWLAGEIAVTFALIAMIVTGSLSFATVFMLVWLCAWTVGGFVAGREFLWGVFGSEQIIATPRFLSIKRSYRIWSNEDNFDAQDVKNLRTVIADGQQGTSLKGNSLASPRKNGAGGAIKFDFGRETRGFGIGLDSVEAGLLVDDIKAYFPND